MVDSSTTNRDMTFPAVSICIPTFEEPGVLRKLLDSIAIQDFKNFEVIITDDSSSDDVERVVHEYGDILSVRYTRNVRRLGTPENWNESIRLATGEYIKIMHHDDWFSREDSLSSFVMMLEHNADSSLAFSAGWNVYGKGRTPSIYRLTPEQLKTIRNDRFSLYYRKGIAIGAPSQTIFRKSANLFFDRNLKWFVDIDFYIRLLNNNPNFVYSEEPLVCVSDIAESRVTRTIDSTSDLSERIYVFNKIKENNLKDVKLVNSISHRLIEYDEESFKKARSILRNNNLIFIYYLGVLLRFRVSSARFVKRQLKSLLIYLRIWSHLQGIRSLIFGKRA